MLNTDNEYLILSTIHDSRDEGASLSQRDIARSTGISIGMVNLLLKRLAERGWLMLRKANGRNLSYAVTPDGMNELARRGYRYFKKTIRDIAGYRERIEELVLEAKAEGYSTILLVGASELEFMIDYYCVRHGVGLVMRAEAGGSSPKGARQLVVYAENYQGGGQDAPMGSCRKLSDELLLGVRLGARGGSVS